ncbi:integral membrane protein S linking to the trans Golgi network-domain-containing protein [Phlyctochytrium arcticum]|nr:integral membrane protein S linking to the trans Golgi network-domain-containing protein [Phlyctochytrium arcticum]
MSSASFRSSSFDPILITAQIVGLQCAYYASSSIIILILELLTGSNITLNHVLAHDELTMGTAMGWGLFLANLINAVLGSYYLVYIVARAKLCLDFAVTLHILHLLFSCAYTHSFPPSLFWWFSFICTLAILALGGEYLCLQRDLEPITLAGSKKRQASSAQVDQVELQRLTEVDNDIP